MSLGLLHWQVDSLPPWTPPTYLRWLNFTFHAHVSSSHSTSVCSAADYHLHPRSSGVWRPPPLRAAWLFLRQVGQGNSLAAGNPHAETTVVSKQRTGIRLRLWLLNEFFSTLTVSLFFFLKKCYWSIVNLQWCVSFRCTVKWMSHPHTYVLSHWSHVRLFATPWTVARQAPLSMGFSRQGCWSGLLFPLPGNLPWPKDWT